MNIQDCYGILQVPPGAGLDEIKSAFRRQAFRLHPDLNPSPKAAEQFRRLNEAYVLLTHAMKDGAQAGPGTQGQRRAGADPGDAQAKSSKAKAEKAYARQRAAAGPSTSAKDAKPGGFYFREEEVLRDLLSDPFARQVFEDIYSQLKTESRGAGPQAPGAAFGAASAHRAQPEKRRRLNIQWGEKNVDLDMSKGFFSGIGDGIKGWLRGQLDYEQTVHYPAHALGPGRALRLTVSSRFGQPRTVEITLPQDFVPGRPIRLKSLGRKLGPFTGDLILRVLAR